MIRDVLFRLRAVFRGRTVEKELDDELQFHFEHEVEKLVRSGLTRQEALRRSRLAFGGLDQVKEESAGTRHLVAGDGHARSPVRSTGNAP